MKPFELKGNEAFSNESGLNFDTTAILQSDELGSPTKMIDVEALDSSARAFWRFHEKKLWAIMVCCCFYILMVML